MPSEPLSPSFDLTLRPWLPVLRLDSSQDELSLREVFEQAHQVRRLVGDVPTQEFALLRLLLAVLHDALQGPQDAEEWHELWQEEALPADRVGAYLTEHRDRFDLLHPRTPFFQVAGLRTAKGEWFSLDRIVADVPNNERFFTMRARGVARLGCAEAARWVVHAHAFDCAGIKSGAVGDPRVKGGKGYPSGDGLGVGWAGNLGGVFAEGRTLRETLLLNLVAADTDNLRIDADDRPAWRRDPLGPGPTGAVELASRPSGVRDLYTWPSRRLRLYHDADGVYGVVLGYGDPLPSRNLHRREPMTAWRRSPFQEKKLGRPQVYLPRENDPARAAWRGLGALVTGHVRGAEQRGEAADIVRPRILDWVARLTTEGYLPERHLIRARVVGAVYGTQQSVIDDVVDDGVAMSVVLLHRRDERLGQAAVGAVGDAEEAVGVLGELAAALAEAAGVDTDAPKSAARDLGFGTLDGHFRDWLGGLGPGDDPEACRRAWQQQAHQEISRLGDQLLAEAPPAAWEGRVVQTKNGAQWFNASRADLRFRTALRKALPMSSAEQSLEVQR